MPPPWARGDPNRDYQLLSATDDSEAQRQAKPVTAGRLFRLARPEAARLAVASLFLLLASVGQVAFPKLAGDLIDVAIQQQEGGSPAEARRTTNRILFQILGVVVASGAADGLRSWLFQSAAERVMYHLRVHLFAALLQQEVGFYDRVRTGELTNRLSEDTRLLKSVATTSIAQALRSAAVCSLGLAMMFATSWLLASLTLCIIPPLFFFFWLFGRLSRRYIKEQLAASARANTVAEECFANLRTVRSFAKEAAMLGSYEAAQERTLHYGLRSARLEGFFFPLNSSLATGAIMAILWYGARQVIAGELTAGKLSSFVVYAVYVAANAGMLMGVFANVVQALGASERVFQLLDRQPQQDLNGGTLRPLGAPEGSELRLQGVWFAYPSRPGVWVLQGFDLHVPPGKTVALVGPSGGGKSTAIGLIERFYDPQRGLVLLDGTSLTSVQHSWLHQRIALVSQEPVLFADTIAANIAFGCPGGTASQEQLEEAARVANAHEFVSAFPQGYQTLVGERGVRLSGGQKQRIAIARAVIMRPRVLLLDEATSALDAENEHLVQEALDRASAGRSVLVIAHRLSTVQAADCVVVVQEGRVAEQGTHSELLAAGGVYQQLVRRQLFAGSGARGGGGVQAEQREGGEEAAVHQPATHESLTV